MSPKKTRGVELRRGAYWVDGEPFFMYSGEFHYFRVAAKDWPDRLRQARRLGLNTVASYIPWVWHEPVEGEPDLTGKTHPQRNLVRFLELVAENGLRFFARPGPVTHGELKNDGLPAWLVQKPGGINVKLANGEPCWCPWLPSFFKPVYQEKVKAWYSAVMPVLARFQAAQGGPVVQVQLDNEIHMINWLGKLADHNPETTRRYQDFLRQRYPDITALNRAYGTAFADFAAVVQPAGDPEKETWTRLWDWALYYRDHYAGYFEFLAQEARRHGLQVPVSANVAQFVDFNMYGRGWESVANTTVFRDFAKKVPGAVFGGAFQMRHLDFENFHDIEYTIESLRSISDPDSPTQCAELQVGVINDRPRIYPSDVELNIKTAAAHGVGAINGYMMFGGRSPEEIQLRGNYHEWQAVVDSRGKWRPHAEPVQRFGRMLGAFGPAFAQAQTRHDLVLAYDPHYFFTEFIQGPFYDRVQRERNWHLFDGAARVLALLGFTPGLADLERLTVEEMLARGTVWMFALDFISRSVADKLVAFVEQGGRLVLNPGVPQKNERMEADDRLVRGLGLDIFQVRPMYKGNQYRWADSHYMIESDMVLFSEGAGEVLVRDREGLPCVVRRRVGRGDVLALGFGLYHQYDYVVELTRVLTSKLGIEPDLKKTAWDVHAALRVKEDAGWLYVANFHDLPRPQRVEFSLGRKSYRFPQRGELILPNRSAYFFPVHLPLADGWIAESGTCEVLDVKRSTRPRALKLLIRGVACQATELRLAGPARWKQVRLDQARLAGASKSAGGSITFLASGDLQTLEIIW